MEARWELRLLNQRLSVLNQLPDLPLPLGLSGKAIGLIEALRRVTKNGRTADGAPTIRSLPAFRQNDRHR